MHKRTPTLYTIIFNDFNYTKIIKIVHIIFFQKPVRFMKN